METGTMGETDARPAWVGLPGGLLTAAADAAADMDGAARRRDRRRTGAHAPARRGRPSGRSGSLVLAWGWVLLGRNWRSWRYAERADDLLISRGVLWREETVVPYGRMQLVEVTSGPLERRFGLASVQLHTAAAATDAKIPGLAPAEAERLRDRLTALGEARSAGL